MEKERQKILENLWVRVMLIGFSIGVFFVLCYFLRGTIISLLLAFIVAYILDPIVDFFEQRHWPFTHKHIHRGFGIVFIMIAVLLVTSGFLAYAIPKTTKGVYQVGSLIKKQYPKYETTIEKWIEKYGSADFAQSVESLLKGRGDPVPKYNHEHGNAGNGVGAEQNGKQAFSPPQETDAAENDRQQKMHLARTLEGFKRFIPQVAGFFLNIAKNIFYSTFGIFGIFVNIIIFGVVSVYLLMDFNIISQKIKDIFPLSKREQAVGLLSKVNNNLRYFLRGQLIICLILSLIYSIGLTITGVPLSFLIGFIGGFGNLIPYVGTGTGIVLASLLALFQFHDFRHVLYVLITFGIGQILEGTVITPRIMGKGLGLSPVMVILSILICSQLLGFLGLLLAVPIASTAKVFIDEFLLKYKSSRYYKS